MNRQDVKAETAELIMKSHIKYLSYVLRHKWHVARGGMIFGVGWWRILKHDWTKFLPSEWRPYARRFYGGGAEDEDFKRAWLHHIHSSDHHWQHWVLLNDDGTVEPLRMPAACVREMVADWYGAGYAITGRNDLESWYEHNGHKMTLHPSAREAVGQIIGGL